MVRSSSSHSLLVVLTSVLVVGCRGNEILENRFAANPQLQSSPNPSPTAIENASPNVQASPTVQASPSPVASPQNSPTPQVTIEDADKLAKLHPAWRSPIESLVQLKIIENQSLQQPITRAEFARWLWQANETLFADQASKQIRPAQASSSAVFSDVPPSHPDFAIIQGLAEAGLIPSALTNDPSATSFRPDAAVNRETLLLWKVPLDQRGALPRATLDSIKETWGFQDTAKIDPKLFPALYADYQSGDRANVKRVYGFTTLLQPKKPVTRAEAAVALSYIGTALEGVSATEVLNRPQPTPSPE